MSSLFEMLKIQLIQLHYCQLMNEEMQVKQRSLPCVNNNCYPFPSYFFDILYSR